jgi:hypothetical protein
MGHLSTYDSIEPARLNAAMDSTNWIEEVDTGYRLRKEVFDDPG